MADLTDKLSQIGDVVLLTNAYNYFQALNAKMQESIGKELSMKTGYLSKYEVTDELRKALREEYREAPPAEAEVTAEEFSAIREFLDPTKDMLEIGKNESNYNNLETFLKKLAKNAKGAFDPTLFEPFETPSFPQVYPVPNEPDLDVRRHGRFVGFDAFEVGVKKWLISNAPLYGFAMYEDYGLYFIGFKEIQTAATSNTALAKIINQFQKTPIPAGDIRLTSATLAAAEDPVGLPLDPVSFDGVVTDNDGNQFTTLYRLDSQTVRQDVAEAYGRMFAAARSAGINLRVSSGFRPATGPSVKWTAASGATGKLTTQETLRRDEGRYIQSHKDYAMISQNKTVNGDWGSKTKKEAFVFYAASGAYNAATAPPGKSNHGSGIAIDLNTGTRGSGFSPPLNDANYIWLCRNSYKFGFIRAVSSEEWHFEYRPEKAAQGPYGMTKAGEAGRWYADLGLNSIDGYTTG